MFSLLKHRLAADFALLALVLLALLIYLPGINGPFVFDDKHNILTAELVRMDQLDLTQVLDAAYSAGGRYPNRGLARVTFALNYYFSGASYDSRAFKLTNIFIHLFNAVLVYLLAKALFLQRSGVVSGERAKWTALFAAGVWLLHPLQLTSVLYVVQRMTSLAALFVFAGLLIYVYGRVRVQGGERHGLLMMAVGIGAGTALGLLNKENAALLPFLAYVLHLAFFPTAALDKRVRRHLRAFHLLFVGAALIIAIIGIAWSWSGFVAGFEQGRDFTMGERVLTQPRVLWLYLSLFLFPSLRQLSLHHDEFLTSTGLLSPPSTLLAALVLVLIVAFALYRLRSGALWAFAVVFFVVGQSMESSFLPLEMVHEHRNYLPSFALAMLLAHLLDQLFRVVTRPMLITGLIAMSVLCALSVVTWARVGIWSNDRMLAEYVVEQHPHSYRSLLFLAAVQARQRGTVQEVFDTYRRTAHINASTVAPLIRMRRIVAAMQFHLNRGAFAASPVPAEALAVDGWDPPVLYLHPEHLALVAAALNTEVLRRLLLAPINVETLEQFEDIRRCLIHQLDMCFGVVDEALIWLRAALAHGAMTDTVRANMLSIAAQHEEASGDFESATASLREAREYFPDEPYFLMRQVLLLGQQGHFSEAKSVLQRLRAGQDYSRSDRRNIDATRAGLERMRAQAMVKSASPERAAQPER